MRIILITNKRRKLADLSRLNWLRIIRIVSTWKFCLYIKKEVLGLPQIIAEYSNIFYNFKGTACKDKRCKSLFGFRDMEICALSRERLLAVMNCYRSLYNEVPSWYWLGYWQIFSICTLFVFAWCICLPK